MYPAALISHFHPSGFVHRLVYLSLVFCLSGCHIVKTSKSLDTAESIFHEHPDSALSIIRSIDGNALVPGRQTARYALLLSAALDKNYIDVANDSIVSIAYDYYQKHGSLHHRMLSYYYAGVVHQNAGDDLRAAVEFDKALYIAQELNDRHYAGLSSQHLSKIHNNNYNHVQALEYSKHAVFFFDSCGETLSADYARADMATQLRQEHDYDKALVITNSILAHNDYPPLVKKCLWLKTELLLYGMHDYPGALYYLEQIPQGLNHIDSLSYYGYKAILAERTGDSASANHLFSLADGVAKTDLDSLTLWNQKAGVYETRGDYQQAFTCLRTATNIQSRKITELLGQSVTRELENHYRQSFKEEKEASRIRTLVFLLAGSLLLLVIAVLAFALRRLHLGHIQDMVDIESLNEDILSLRSSNDQFRRVSDAVISDRIQFMRQLSESYFSWTDEEVRKREKEKGISSKDEIITRFRHQLGDLRSDKQLLTSLESAVDLSQDGIMEKVRAVSGGKLKESDYIVLTLLLSGLSIKSSAFLLRMSEPALRTRKSRYRQFFAASDHPDAPLILERL